jgi:hypothetical protein
LITASATFGHLTKVFLCVRGVVSPVIANAFLDHVLAQWFIRIVTHHCRGYCTIIRYADGTPVQA